MSRSHLLAFAILGAALPFWSAAPAVAGASDLRTPTVSTVRIAGDTTVGAQLAKLLGPGKRLRDFAPFTTERGESAFLVLFVTNANEPQDQRNLAEMSCPEEVAGTPLIGTYHVALVLDGRLVNEVPIPGNEDPSDSTTSVVAFPLRNTRYNNHYYWGEGDLVAYDDPAAKVVEPTKLIMLADYNGDGHAWEFRLVHDGESCGHKDTLLAGYSAKRRRAIIYPIVMGKELLSWHDNFFPDPRHPDASIVQYQWGCGDHGNDVFDDQRFEYNPPIEAWAMTRHESHLCIGDYVGKDRAVHPTPTPTDVRVHVGSARGAPGETVSIPVTIDPRGANATGIQVELPVDWQFKMKGCTAAGSPFATFQVSPWGVQAVLAVQEGDADWSPGAVVFTCQVAISPYAPPGPYMLSASGLLVKGDWITRLQATATDGEIFVTAPVDPTPVGSR